ncbi:MAG: D-alanine--D-alanine ligase family protein [Clostridia bacterium]|nr:D-alanine--D-alanine ligase family protein [Clostridia bacterium]
MKTVVGVFFGGKSVEHEVSIISAMQVINVLNKEKYEVIPIYISKDNKFYYSDKFNDVSYFKDIDKVKNDSVEVYFTHFHSKMMVYSANSLFKKEIAKIDVVFPVVHGLNVEDGTLQGFIEMYNIPYVGPDVSASAVGMNKIIFKKVLESSDIPVIEYVTVNSYEYEEDPDNVYYHIKSTLGLPVILKPANLGSSIGIEIVTEDSEFQSKMENVLLFTDRVLVERCVTNLREINCSVLGDVKSQDVSILEEPIKADEILSFHDKYMGGNKKSGSKLEGMASLSRKIPAELEEEKRQEIYDLSKKVFQILGCEGVSRIDFIIDVDKDKIYVNEINTIPGSLSFYLWEKKGIVFDKLCDDLIKLAIKRYERRQKIVYSHDVNILNMTGKK